ncbi:MAG: porin [Rhodanobacter sp.]|nr:MAG: porin [Rhodanobacter sp.]TAM04969.1 MAG: porin [Rhodanobacter sp.]TAM40698.1 MAG: porin [Rhodanobacter sp.]TAN22837.1 MAG: porin [Rhodanobacter sp.]
MKKHKAIAYTLGILASLAGAVVHAEGFQANHYITGDWGGERAKLADEGVTFKLGYFSEGAKNTSGGNRHTTAYADQFFLGGYFDLDKLVGWRGAEFKVEVTNRNGTLINNEAGMPFLLQSQQIYGRGTVTRLTQFSLTQHLFADHLSIKAGRLYPDADFFAMSCAFQNLTFCSGGSSNYINSGWYGDPLSALGVVAAFTPDEHWYFKAGSYNTNKDALSKSHGLRLWPSGGWTGTMLVGEVEYKADYGDGIDGDYRIGAIRNNGSASKIYNQAGFPVGLTPDPVGRVGSSHAFYVNLEQQVFRNASGGGLRLFASLIRPDKQMSQVGEVLAVGGFINGAFPSRPNDRIGLAFARNAVSSKLTAAQLLYNRLQPVVDAAPVGVQRHEYLVELNYNIALAPGIEVMPSIQYVRHPNGLANVANATVLGVQFSLNF